VTTNENWRRYLEAGAAVGQVTLARAEGIAKGLFGPDDEERETAWHDLDELTRFGRQMGDQLIDMARAEMSRHLEALGVGSLDQFLDRITDLVRAQPVDSPSQSAESRTKPERLENTAGHQPPQPSSGQGVGTKKAPKADQPKAHKADKSKPKRKKASVVPHDLDGRDASLERRGAKKHGHDKKHKKQHKSEKNSGSQAPPSGPNRLLTLAPPPSSADGV
jgi:hypothetical protein